jgi:hypothetical protein
MLMRQRGLAFEIDCCLEKCVLAQQFSSAFKRWAASLFSSYIFAEDEDGGVGAFNHQDDDDDDDDKVDTDDEGIEQDHYNDSSSSDEACQNSRRPVKTCLIAILNLCENHLSVGSEAEAHYRNVCRALVSEAMELSSFLVKASAKDSDSEELRQLALKDWVGYIIPIRLVNL